LMQPPAAGSNLAISLEKLFRSQESTGFRFPDSAMIGI